MRNSVFALMLLCGTALTACNEDAERTGPCDSTNTFEYNGADYCVVIEEGFLTVECPEGLPQGREFDQFTICSDAASISDEIEEKAWERGFGTPPPCVDGEQREAGDGCNTCMCNDGAWMCTTAECGSFQECIAACQDCEVPGEASYVGESPEECMVIEFQCDEGVSSFSNECGCGCLEPTVTPECEEGETQERECQSCVCVDGAFQCTQNDEQCIGECLVDCPECEQLTDPGVSYVANAERCMVIDYSCDEGFDGFSNECGCGCKPAEDMTCVEGDTRTELCNECVCTDGAWQCDTQDCTDLETCLAACGDGCPEERYQVCSEEGDSYCNACEATCYEATLAPNREPCDCPVPLEAPLAVRLFEVPEGCVDTQPNGGEAGVATSIFEAAAWFLCEPGVTVDVEFGVEVLVRAVFPENPEPSVQGAFFNEATGDVQVVLTAPQYCGGPAPFTSVVYFYVPAVEDPTYTFENCVHTLCTEFFP